MGRRGTRLHGRSREMSALMALLDQAGTGHPEPVLLVGDAGMGKSALLDEFALRARSVGVHVSRAAAPQGGEMNPFALVEPGRPCVRLPRIPWRR